MSVERTVMRPGDMDNWNNKSRLILHIQEDGDIVVTVLQKKGDHIEKAEIEFCTSLSGGGRSPKTFVALVKLFEAMQKEDDSALER